LVGLRLLLRRGLRACLLQRLLDLVRDGQRQLLPCRHGAVTTANEQVLEHLAPLLCRAVDVLRGRHDADLGGPAVPVHTDRAEPRTGHLGDGLPPPRPVAGRATGTLLLALLAPRGAPVSTLAGGRGGGGGARDRRADA